MGIAAPRDPGSKADPLDRTDPLGTPPESAAPGQADGIAALRADQRRRWHKGERVLVEVYLHNDPTLEANEEGLLDLIYNEMVLREEIGEPPPVEEYLRRFPRLGPALQRQLALHQALEEGSLEITPPSVVMHDPSSQNTLTAPDDRPLPRRAGLADVAGYEILGELGRGGMGVVYKARQTALNRIVALKMILAGDHAGTQELNRFRREAELIARLQHPNLVQIYEVGEQQGRPFFSLEFLDGGSLDRRLDGTPWPARQAGQLVETLARAMHAAHQQGIVHRDLKPGNILLTADGTPKITDFGMAKRLDHAENQTQTGTIVGTPSYMAPEQALGQSKSVGPAADVYALGAILYELITGRPPFKGATVLDTLDQVRHQEPVPPGRLQHRLPQDLETICLKCLEKEPRKRYPGAGALADDLRRFLAHEPILARPVGWPERAVKWARRRPAAAALVAVSTLGTALVIVGLAISTALIQQEKQQAVAAFQEKSQAFDERNQAYAELEQKEQRAQRELYLQRIAQADRHWWANNVRQTEQYLDGCIPVVSQPDLRRWEWYYLRRLCAAYQLDLHGHTGSVTGVACDPRGRYLASASEDKTVRVWDAQTGKELQVLRGHDSGARAVAFSPDGTRLASAGADGMVILWELATGRPLQRLRGHAGIVTCVAFRPDGRQVASGGAAADSEKGEIKLWDVGTGTEVRSLHGSTGEVRGVAYSPDGKRLASAEAGKNHSVLIWDMSTGQPLHSLKGHPGPVNSIAFSPDGRHVVSGSGDAQSVSGVIKIWDADQGQVVLSIRGHSDQVAGVAYSPDGKRIASASWDQTVKVWDAATGKEVRTFRGHLDRALSVAFRPDGRGVVSGSDDLTVKGWDATHDQESVVIRGPTDEPRAFDLSRDGTRLAAAVGDVARGSEIEVRETTTGRRVQTLRGPLDKVTRLLFAPDGGRLVSADATDGRTTVRIWDLASGKELRRLPVQKAGVWALAFHPDGRQLVVAGKDGSVRVWDSGTGQLLQPLRAPKEEGFTFVLFSPDGQLLITVDEEKRVTLWNAVTAQAIRSFRVSGDSLAFSPDRKRLAFVSPDHEVQVWDTWQGEKRLTLPAQESDVKLLRFSPDGNLLAMTGADPTVRVWDPATGKQRATLSGHTGPVWDVAFSPDNQRLASASDDGTVKVWDLTVGQEALTLHMQADPSMRLDFSPSGELLSCMRDNEVRIWNAAPLAHPSMHPAVAQRPKITIGR